MKWNDEEQIDLTPPVMGVADGRDDDAGLGPLRLFHYRKPEVQVPIVSTSHQLGVAEIE